jgi:hypothetical protein
LAGGFVRLLEAFTVNSLPEITPLSMDDDYSTSKLYAGQMGIIAVLVNVLIGSMRRRCSRICLLVNPDYGILTAAYVF